MSSRTHVALLICMLSVSLMMSCGQDETFEPPKGEGPWILVDLYHTRIQNPEDYRLTKTEYNYQGTYGYARVFDHLEDNDYKWRSIRELELSPARLEGFDVLFINLVHQERPDFSADEVEAIKDFVREGGGLFVISDHTNVYYHAERINQFLVPMGVEVTYHSALEPGENSLSGLGWIAVEDFTDHPVNDGVELLGFQTGGPMRSLDPAKAQGTALTSQKAFGDFWDESTGAGFYGNWTFDGDTSKEPRGPFPVSLAAEYGKGRIIVTGDQNIYGDAFVHFGDNFRHAMNAFEWLAKQEDLSPRPLADIKPHGFNIGVDSRLSEWATGNGGLDNYYTFFVNFNRDAEVTGRGITRFDQRDDALVLPSPKAPLAPADVEAIIDYLAAGKKVVLSFELPQLQEDTYRSTIELIGQLAPDFSVTLGDEQISFEGDTDAIVDALRQIADTSVEGHAALQSNRLDVEGLELASVRVESDGDTETRTPYLLDLTSSWGEDLLSTSDGRTIARSKRVGAGELIIFVQDGFWRNRTTGISESDPPTPEALQATALQFSLMDYLKRPLMPCVTGCGPLPSSTLSLKPEGEGPWILADLYHTTKQNHEDYKLKKDDYDYQGTHGYSRAFDHLSSQGYKWRSIRQLPLTTERLEGFDTLFINLVHDDRPDFSTDEIEAIQDFVRQGGGLLVVADHSNVYYHADRINQFLIPMGIEVTPHTAIDYGAQQVTGLAWIAINELSDHPINEGIDLISFQTGGVMTPSAQGDAQVTARLSRVGFGDLWDESTGIGFYGNWVFDGDPASEPRGPLPVGMAADYGEGRVVVVGDQNMFGDVWLHFGDNFKHWLNIHEWLADAQGDVPLRQTRPRGTLIGIDTNYAGFAAGNNSPDNYYTFFVNLNRDAEITARATSHLDASDDVLVLPPANRPYDAQALLEISRYLDQGKRVVVLGESDRWVSGNTPSASVALIHALAPDFSVNVAGETISFEQTDASLHDALKDASWDRPEGRLDLESTHVNVSDLALTTFPSALPDESPSSYYVDVSSDWGERFIGSAQGADVARKKRVGSGELIIFLQDGFWRVRTLGQSEVTPPSADARAALELQYRVMEYFKRPLS